MPKEDPWMLNKDEAKKLKEKAKGSSKGVVCPKRNPGISGKCAACDKAASLWAIYNKTKQEEDRKVASQISAKCKYFMNVVFPNNPTKLILMEIGKKVGDEILSNIEDDWTDIAHPKKDMGRELKITRKGSGVTTVYNVKTVDKAKYDIPKEVLENLHNLDNIVELIQDESIEYFNVSKLKPDESVTFKLCPPWNYKNGDMRPMQYLWRHWNVTQSQIDGTEEITVTLPDDDQTSYNRASSTEREVCFGNSKYFKVDSEMCNACKDFKECSHEIDPKF